MEFKRTLPGPTAQLLLENVKEVGCYICSQFWDAADEGYRSAVENGSLEGSVASYAVDIKPVGKKAQRLGLEMKYKVTRKPRIRGLRVGKEERNVEKGGENKRINEGGEQKVKPHRIWVELVPVESRYFCWFDVSRFFGISVFKM
jgi:hypothetical protein